MRFYKVHELGNDFVLFDGRGVGNVDWKATARKVCDRHTGVGANGALILQNSAIADVRMRSFNADGDEIEPYGSGLRAFSRYCFENGAVRGTSFSVETDAGVTRPRIVLKNGRVDGVRIDMGIPRFDMPDTPGEHADGASPNGDSLAFTAVRVGIPHAVVFVDPAVGSDASQSASPIEDDPRLPAKARVSLVEVVSRERVKVCARKRGCGCVPADGTDACAAAVACVLNSKTGRSITVELDRGTLQIEWSGTDDHICLTGPAEIVFSGVIRI